MAIKPIRTEEEYRTALVEIDRLFDAALDTPEGDTLEVLTVLVEAYEKEHYPFSPPDPIEAITFHMERLGLTRKDLEPYIGSRARVSEILNRKRPLTLRMIRALAHGMGIPAAILVQEYALKQDTAPAAAPFTYAPKQEPPAPTAVCDAEESKTRTP
ncbi:MAG: helix-turn-helix domain-containing protein [Anaerolineae bacterium]|nr:helix-turn-helix domain-containing protein [Anaerolineae bacterium]